MKRRLYQGGPLLFQLPGLEPLAGLFHRRCGLRENYELCSEVEQQPIGLSQALLTWPPPMPIYNSSEDEFLSRGRIFNTHHGYICPDLSFAQSTTGNIKRSKKNEAGACVTMRTLRSVYTVF